MHTDYFFSSICVHLRVKRNDLNKEHWQGLAARLPAKLASSQGMTSSLWILALALILLVGGGLRFYQLNWDENQHAHPDERYIIWVATSIHWPAGLNTWSGWQAAFAPKQSTLNPFYWSPHASAYNIDIPQDQPRTFAYGHLPLYLLVMAVNGLAVLTRQPQWLSYGSLTLVGRAISGAFDLGTVAMTFLLGRRLFGKAAGLLAAALLALAPLHIQLAHFYTVDTVMTFFITAALWLMARYLQEQHLRDALAAGVCAGLAMGAKFTALWLLGVLTVVMMVDAWPELQRRNWKSLGALAATLAAACLAFAVTNPFALIELRTFLAEITREGSMVRGTLDWTYTRQYHNTAPYLYPLWQMFRFGLGPAFTLAGVTGLGWAAWRAWRQAIRVDELMGIAWAASFFALTGGMYVKFIRYTLPLTPALAVLAAALLIAIARTRRGLGMTFIIVTVGTSGLNGWAFASMYSSPHPWVAASRWVDAHVPANAVLAVEHWDEQLRLGSEYTLAELQPYNEPDSPDKLQAMLAALARSDYVVLPTHRLWGTLPRWPERYPLTARYYQALFGEQLGYRLAFFSARYPRLGPLTLMDTPLADPSLPIPSPLREFSPSPLVVRLGRADESFTVYDHPLVLIFSNVERLSAEQMWQRMTNGELSGK